MYTPIVDIDIVYIFASHNNTKNKNIMENLKFDLEVGTKVYVQTSFGIVEGEVTYGYLLSGRKQQIQVSYLNGNTRYGMTFSKKTGKAYGRNPAKREGHYLIK